MILRDVKRTLLMLTLNSGKIIYVCGADCVPSTFAQRHQVVVVLPLQHKAV